MDPLIYPPSENEVLEWFSGYKNAFSFDQNETAESMVTRISSVTTLYRHIFEWFKESRTTAGRTSTQVQKDLRVFGFDYYDLHSDTPARFYSKFAVPQEYRPLPTSGSEFPPDSGVIWPKSEARRYLASFIRNSSAHGSTRVNDGIVTIENKQPGTTVPNFRVFLPKREYVRLIAGSLSYFVERVLNEPGQGNSLGLLKTREYGELVSFFQRFLRELPVMIPD